MWSEQNNGGGEFGGTHPRRRGPRPRINTNICRTCANNRAVYLAQPMTYFITSVKKTHTYLGSNTI